MNQSLAKLNLLKKKAPIPKEKWMMNPKKTQVINQGFVLVGRGLIGPYENIWKKYACISMCQETCRLSNSTKHIPAHIHSKYIHTYTCIHTCMLAYRYIYTCTYVCISMYSSLADQKSFMLNFRVQYSPPPTFFALGPIMMDIAWMDTLWSHVVHILGM